MMSTSLSGTPKTSDVSSAHLCTVVVEKRAEGKHETPEGTRSCNDWTWRGVSLCVLKESLVKGNAMRINKRIIIIILMKFLVREPLVYSRARRAVQKYKKYHLG